MKKIFCIAAALLLAFSVLAIPVFGAEQPSGQYVESAAEESLSSQKETKPYGFSFPQDFYDKFESIDTDAIVSSTQGALRGAGGFFWGLLVAGMIIGAIILAAVIILVVVLVKSSSKKKQQQQLTMQEYEIQTGFDGKQYYYPKHTNGNPPFTNQQPNVTPPIQQSQPPSAPPVVPSGPPVQTPPETDGDTNGSKQDSKQDKE